MIAIESIFADSISNLRVIDLIILKYSCIISNLNLDYVSTSAARAGREDPVLGMPGPIPAQRPRGIPLPWVQAESASGSKGRD